MPFVLRSQSTTNLMYLHYWSFQDEEADCPDLAKTAHEYALHFSYIRRI